MLWIFIYVSCVIIVGVYILIEYSYSSYDRSDNIFIVWFLICAPVVLIFYMFGGLKELIGYIHYYSRFWIKQTVGIIISDMRWVYAINGILKQEKSPEVYRAGASGEMKYAGRNIHSKESIVMINPMSGGRYYEMKFMIRSFLKESIQFFSLKTFYNIAIPVVTTESERRALLDAFRSKKVKTMLIPEVISNIIDESNFGLIYLAHTFTEVSIVENNSLHEYTFGNIGLDDLSKSIIKAVSPSLITGVIMRRKALESLMNEYDFQLHGPDNNTKLPLEVTVTMSDLKKYSAQWISSIHKLFTKLSVSNFKWYIISDFGQLNVIAKLLSEECSVKIYPINNSQELIAKELSIMDPWTRM